MMSRVAALHSMKSVSIVIPCLNSSSTLPQTIESLISEEYLREASIYLLDGGSVDFTREVVDHYRSTSCFRDIEIIDFPGIHPAERVNRFIELRRSEYAFVCHSDDIYIPSAMERMALELDMSECWAMGAQCLYFEDPVDASRRGKEPYSGGHFTHPILPSEIYCEMALWWCVSWNTILLNTAKINEAGLKIDHESFPFCNDYAFNRTLAELGKISNAPYASVLTRHRVSGDGPAHREFLSEEASQIRRLHRDNTGLSDFLGPHLLLVLESISYQYSNWSVPECPEYAVDHYFVLARCLDAFAGTSPANGHFRKIAEDLMSALKDRVF
jgi:glycosyltransferase involved in cell wall biosynthesis